MYYISKVNYICIKIYYNYFGKKKIHYFIKKEYYA